MEFMIKKTKKTGRPALALTAAVLALFLVFAASCAEISAEEGYDQVAGSGAMGSVREGLAPYGMTPVSGSMIEDGEYVVSADSSSTFFKIEEARLTVADGQMTAVLKMAGTGYLLVYPGTAEEAAAAPYEAYIPKAEDEEGWDTFTVPVRALDTELDLAAFSKRRKKWYPRKILLHASDIPRENLLFSYPDYDRIGEAVALYDEQNGTDTLEAWRQGADAAGSTANPAKEDAVGQPEPEAVPMQLTDGEYSIEVDLAGGSGRASVTSPTWLTIRDGRAYARLLWSSSYYDYMILDGKTYLNETKDGSNSTFTIPVTALDRPVQVIADTTAMGDPVEIEYTLTFYEDTVGSRGRIPQEAAKKVLAGAAVFIIAGGILNHYIKKKRR